MSSNVLPPPTEYEHLDTECGSSKSSPRKRTRRGKKKIKSVGPLSRGGLRGPAEDKSVLAGGQHDVLEAYVQADLHQGGSSSSLSPDFLCPPPSLITINPPPPDDNRAQQPQSNATSIESLSRIEEGELVDFGSPPGLSLCLPPSVVCPPLGLVPPASPRSDCSTSSSSRNTSVGRPAPRPPDFFKQFHLKEVMSSLLLGAILAVPFWPSRVRSVIGELCEQIVVAIIVVLIVVQCCSSHPDETGDRSSYKWLSGREERPRFGPWVEVEAKGGSDNENTSARFKVIHS